MIDLRSDTVTRPTAEMREAMARAEVGDDVYGDDPTVKALEARTAELLGKEDAIYMPTGSMTNQVALRTHTEPGDEIVADINAHIYVSESGAPAALSGVIVRPLLGKHGIFTAEQLAEALQPLHAYNPSTLESPRKLVCLENTHNGGGGSVWPLAAIEAVGSVARENGLAMHLDGARLWHASAASGVAESDYASHFDTVSVCFSKGLGAPLGSALAGSGELMNRARRFKQMFGGGFRQAGVVAAGALHALNHHRDGLGDDIARARRLATALSEMPGIGLDPARVETNILRFSIEGTTAFELVERCHALGVHMLPSGTTNLRAVVHRDLDDESIETAIAAIRNAL